MMSMKGSDQVSILHYILITMMAIGLKNHVVVIPPLIQVAGRDSWLSVIFAYGFTLIWGLLVIYIYNGTKAQNMTLWLQQSIGKVATMIFNTMIVLYLIFLATLMVKETVIWTNVSYLQETPAFVLTLFLTVVCFFLAITSFRAIAIANVFFLSAVIVFGFFVAFVNMQFKDFSLLKPFLEHGYEPVIMGMVYPASGMIEMIMILFLQHKIKGKIRYKHIIIIGLLLTWLTLGPLIGAIIEFGPAEAARQRFPAYEEWGLARIGRFFEHLDFLSVYQWLTGAFIRVSLLLFVSTEIFQLQTKKKKIWFLLIIVTMMNIVALLPISDLDYYKLLKFVFIPFTFIFFLTVSLLLGFVVFFFKNKSKQPKKEVKM